ncbi:MAG: thioredoxin domain-containing protein, partial [Proteobacteria bacterium]|nr:thioredoxin domain-containing protein [Pseudomonadota bacterium]
PLTVFLTPDTHMPIFAGTYFPKEEKHGLPAFKFLLQQIADIWQTRKADIQQQSGALQSTYQRIYQATRPEVAQLDHIAIDVARNQIEKQFDSRNGGFSGAPKFPHPSILEFSLQHWAHTRHSPPDNPQTDQQILHCASFTLSKMANGGIFDHLGGGFCRYSTDELWMIPHFEKMLYDNGPLLSLYSKFWQLGADSLFFDTASETANWIMREMQSPQGGYYASQDADSEGHEGTFFVWSKKEINSALDSIVSEDDSIDAQAVTIFRKRFGLNLNENFVGRWHLHGYIAETTLAEKSQLDGDDLHEQLKNIRQRLFKYREQRTHPDTDHKILCAWNGLMIHGMAIASRALDKPTYRESAKQAAYFLKNNCWLDGHLFAGYKDGRSALGAYLDDYAFLIYGLLELLQSQWDEELYDWTLALADSLLLNFEDTEHGGFFFTSHSHENLIQRLKSFSDDAIPSGNAIAAFALNRLGYLSGRQQYIAAAERCIRSAWSAINQAPISHCALLNSLYELLTPPDLLIMRPTSEDSEHWASLSHRYFLPSTMVFCIPAESTLHPTLSEKVATDSSIAYPCTGALCHTTLKSEEEVKEYLQNNSYRVLE